MSDQLRPYVVIVNNGSGCVFQPVDITVSYILTAKHNLTNAGNTLNSLIRFELDGGIWSAVNVPFAAIIAGENFFPHPELDIAIITVPRIEVLAPIYRTDDLNEQQNAGYFLMGYPQGRREANPNNNSAWFRADPILQIFGINNQAREFVLPGNANQQEVTGQSGGPVLVAKGDKVMLAGIETNMARANNENMGRAEFFPLKAFDKIIALYPEQLSSLLPAHLSCFSFLLDQAFELDAGFSQDNIEGIKSFLLFKAKEVTQSGTTPNFIKEQFSKRLLIAEQQEEILQTKEIWKIWLEFLTIIQILKDKTISAGDLDDLFNSVRLLHSDSDKDWSGEIRNIIYSDYKGLADKGVVVISMRKPPANNEYFIDGNIPQIATAKKNRERDKLLINQGMIFPFDHFKFVHMDFFKGKSIIEKHLDYSTLEDDQQYLDKLKQEYGTIFQA